MERVSVVFPIGPGVATAGAALADLRAQSHPDVEILAVLNACLPEVRREFQACSDKRLKLFDLGDEPSLLGALDLAVEKSTGKWLARMDSDDRCAPDRLARQVALLESGTYDLVSCGISLREGLGEGMQRYVDWVNGLEDPAKERFVESPVVQPTVVLSKDLFLESGGYLRNGYAEDYDLWLRLLEREVRFGKVRDELYFWHDRNDRLTRSDERFGQKKMLALKAEYLLRLPMVQEKGVVISGAGPIGKVLGRELKARGVVLHGYFEIDPRRVGSTRQGAPIAGPEEFGVRWREAVLLSAVGVPGGREKVRKLAAAHGYEEGGDFWCCC